VESVQPLSGDEPEVALKRRLTLPLLTLYGLGVTVGAGIYVLVSETAAKAGFYAPVSFLLAAAVSAPYFLTIACANFAIRALLIAARVQPMVDRIKKKRWPAE
jgi:amino acid transporter